MEILARPTITSVIDGMNELIPGVPATAQKLPTLFDAFKVHCLHYLSKTLIPKIMEFGYDFDISHEENCDAYLQHTFVSFDVFVLFCFV